MLNDKKYKYYDTQITNKEANIINQPEITEHVSTIYNSFTLRCGK